MGIVFQISLLIGGVLNMFTIDWFGRRFLFLSGLAVMTVVLAMFAAFSERFTSTGNSGKQATLSLAVVSLLGLDPTLTI